MPTTAYTYRFNPPGPEFSLSLDEKVDYPKTYINIANLDLYPINHEVIGYRIRIDHTMPEGHGTTVNHKYFNNNTDELIFENTLYVPEPSTKGYSYWNWYQFYSWIGHCSWEINKPMPIRIEIEVTSNAFPTWTDTRYMVVSGTPPEPPPPEPPPPEPDECPNWWDDLPGAVWCWIVNGFTELLGWVNGSLLTNLGKMWDVISGFSQDVLDFLGDATGTVIKWVQDNTAAIFSWVSGAFLDFVDWLGDLTGSIADYIGGVVGGIVDFVTTQFTTFVTWLNDLGGSIVDYIGGAIGDFVDWSSDQLGSIWEGLQDWFGEAIAGLVEAFFGGLDAGVEEAKGSPLHSDEPVRNPVLKGLQKVVRKHRKKYNRDEITGEKKNGTI